MLLSSYATVSLYQHRGVGGRVKTVNFSNTAPLWVSMLDV